MTELQVRSISQRSFSPVQILVVRFKDQIVLNILRANDKGRTRTTLVRSQQLQI